MRTPLQRLSPGPTVPELMEAEFREWRDRAARTLVVGAWLRPVLRGRMRACFAGASLVLGAARVLLRLGLVTPEFAAGAFRVATVLGGSGVRFWRRARALSSPGRSLET